MHWIHNFEPPWNDLCVPTIAPYFSLMNACCRVLALEKVAIQVTYSLRALDMNAVRASRQWDLQPQES